MSDRPKLALPETEFFYDLAMKRSAEIKAEREEPQPMQPDDLTARARKRAEECELALYRTDAALYRALADRVDEQERRIKELEGDEKGVAWHRTDFFSVWHGPDLELIVVSNASESWSWTARGWRMPDEGDRANRDGWVEAFNREAAEQAALRWYLAKE